MKSQPLHKRQSGHQSRRYSRSEGRVKTPEQPRNPVLVTGFALQLFDNSLRTICEVYVGLAVGFDTYMAFLGGFRLNAYPC